MPEPNDRDDSQPATSGQDEAWDDDTSSHALVDLDDDHIRIFTPETEIESDEELDIEAREAIPVRPDIDTVLEGLESGSLHVSLLYGLSDLSSEELAILSSRWPGLGDDMRPAIVSELVDLAQTEFELDTQRFLLLAATDDLPQVRQAAVTGLGLVEHANVTEELLTILAEDTSDDVRAEAAHSLGPFTVMSELGQMPATLAERLEHSLFTVAEDEDESWHVRSRAAEAAAAFGPSERVERLIHRMWEEDEMGLRASAIYAAGRGNQRGWLPQMMDVIAGDDEELRYEAVRAIGAFGDVETLPQLSEIALRDEDADIRHSAIEAIGAVGGSAAVRVLTRLAERAPESDHEMVEKALMEASLDEDPLFERLS